MDDREIIGLYNRRDEKAIDESAKKYGRYCRQIAVRILSSDEDAKEVENDTYLRAWNTIPPKSPDSLSSYLASICRNLSLDRLRAKNRVKRGSGEYELAFDELSDFISDAGEADETQLRDALDRFLSGLRKKPRVIFMKRYWWASTVREIADEMFMTESAVKMSLMRTRDSLRDYLTKEGFEI